MPIQLTEEQKGLLLRWWSGLEKNRADRAHLRHAAHPAEIVLTDAFGRFANIVNVPKEPEDRSRYAAVAGLFAHVYDHVQHPALGKQMATESTSGRERAISEGRFQRLLRTQDLGDFYEQLRRVLAMLGPRPEVNVVKLAEDVVGWGSEVRWQWAEDYFSVLFVNESAPQDKLQPFRAQWNAETKDAEKMLALCEVWWRTQDERRSEQAALRRCTGLADVQLTPGYHRLRAWLSDESLTASRERLAAAVGLLAHVKKESDTSFPLRLAGLSDDKKNPKDRHPKLSGLRFRRLLAIEDWDERYRALIRALRFVSGELNVRQFAQDLLFWISKGTNTTLHKWAEAYYTAAPSAT